MVLQVAQSRYQLMKYLTWKGGHNRRLFTIFRRLSSWQKEISFTWNCRISGSHVCWREAIQYRYIGSGIKYYVLSQLTYNCQTQGFQLPSIPTKVKWGLEWVQLYSCSAFTNLAMIISDMYNFSFVHYHDANIFFSNFCKLCSPRLHCWLELGTFRSVQ